MPQAVTHVLIAIVIAELIRDYFVKNGRKFPLHYILIAGIAGLLPDIDIIAFWGLYFLGYTFDAVHRTFTHTLFVPLIFLAGFFIFKNYKNKEFGKHHLKLNIICLMIALGTFIHLILDATLAGVITPFYPFLLWSVGLNIISFLPETLENLFLPSLDAVVLVLWLIHEELKHKISRFI